MTTQNKKEKLIAKILELLLETPHLSDQKREQWEKKIPELNESQLLGLFTILAEEKTKFDQSFEEELAKTGKSSDLSKLNEILAKANRRLSQETEAIDREKEAQKLQTLIEKL